jgi:hypothetical protein
MTASVPYNVVDGYECFSSVESACRVHWGPYGSMYINPKNVQKWIGNFEFFLVWKFGDVEDGIGI